MILGTLLTVGYILISYALDLIIIGSIGKNVKKMDDTVDVPKDDSMASPIFISLSVMRVCGLLYLIYFLFNESVPIALFVILAALELWRGGSQMLKHDDMGLPHIRNYYTGKTIGTAIGFVLMTYVIYFK